MSRCRTLIFGLALVQFVCGQGFNGNPYLNGYRNDQRAFLADQQRIRRTDLSSNVFLQHAVASRAIAGFMAPGYLPPVEKQQLICSGTEVCVKKNACNNGYFTQGPPGQRQDCDIDTEECCTYRPPPPPPPPTTTQVPSTPCTGNDYACVPPNLCVNGEIKNNGLLKSQSSGKCFAPEVCCRIPETTVLTKTGYVVKVPETPLPTPPRPTPPRPIPVQSTYLPPPPPPPSRGEEQLSEPILPPSKPPVKCAAALNCTPIEFCSATGMMSKTPVVLTREQEVFRVPLTDCIDAATGIVGKCCRDPDYTDPWPVSQLGQYKAELFGDTGKYNPQKNGKRNGNGNGNGRSSQLIQRSVPSGSAFLSAPFTPTRNQIVHKPSKPIGSQCAPRNRNASPRGNGPYDAAFSEYPWQAMVLLESTKSLLCGGAIIGDDIVATTAHCVQGRKPFDVLIKGGEWKLGRDEEPLTFQLVRVKKIDIHPKYDPSSRSNNMALLHLDAKINFNQHIGPICIDDKPPSPSDECVTTGWGKEALRLHAQDAVMHHSPVSILAPNQCSGYNYGNDLCGVPSINACELDPGSALACSNGRGQYVMKGIYSVEDNCGNAVITFSKPDLQWINAARGKKNHSPRAFY